MQKIISFFRRDTVLCLASLLAVISAFFVHPTLDYLGYIDFRVLAQLFCLMLVVAGFQSIGLFSTLIEKMLRIIHNTRQLVFLFVLSCFFTSMLITNDVALITFVPFAILALRQTHQEKHMIFVLVMQTIAANLGSMFTPLGNPQNLYLYGISQLSLPAFLKTMAPLTFLSLLLIVLTLCKVKPEPLSQSIETLDIATLKRGPVLAFGLLFCVCLLCVLHILSFPVTLTIVYLGVFLLNRQLFQKVDYSLLLTFVAFFVFVGNLKQIPWIYDFLQQIMFGRELLISAVASQFISNVPAAVLLSGFTENYTDLLLGVNIGGLGTLIASMASLISFKFYCRQRNSNKRAYLLQFTLFNIVFFLILYVAAVIFK